MPGGRWSPQDASGLYRLHACSVAATNPSLLRGAHRLHAMGPQSRRLAVARSPLTTHTVVVAAHAYAQELARIVLCAAHRAQRRADATTTKLPMPVTVTAICTGETSKLAKFSCGVAPNGSLRGAFDTAQPDARVCAGRGTPGSAPWRRSWEGRPDRRSLGKVPGKRGSRSPSRTSGPAVPRPR